MSAQAPFQRHSPTSAEAAAYIAPHLQPLEAEVMALFSYAGTRGLTDAELAAEHPISFGKRLDSTLRARRIALTARGLLEDSGTMRVGPSGRRAVVWRAR